MLSKISREKEIAPPQPRTHGARTLSFLDSGMLVSEDYISILYNKSRDYKLIFHYMYGVFADNSDKNEKIVQNIDTDHIEKFHQLIKKQNDWLDKREIVFDLPKDRVLAPWVLGWGGAISFSRDIFESIEGFDENIYGWGGEDSDVSLRLIELANDYLFCKDSYAIHLPHKNESFEVKTKFSLMNREKNSSKEIYS
jgi:GT2 family glycosyltransferase